MLRQVFFAGLSALVPLAFAPRARATVTYTFSGESVIVANGEYTLVSPDYFYRPAYFQLTVPDFFQLSPYLPGPPPVLGTDAFFTCEQGVFGAPCGAADSSVDFPPRYVDFSYQPTVGANADLLVYDYENGNGGAFEFPTGTFEQPGVYDSVPTFPGDSSGVLTVSVNPAPEPQPAALAAIGLLTLTLIGSGRLKTNSRPSAA